MWFPDNYHDLCNLNTGTNNQILTGLDMDGAMIPYMHYFRAENVDGKKLMLMTHTELQRLNVIKFGHQELILEAIDLLRNLVRVFCI